MATSLLFFASVVDYGLAHSIVAQATGVPVRDTTLFIFSGAATLSRELHRPRDEFLNALTGPAASLVVVAGFGARRRSRAAATAPLHALAGWLAGINLTLALFNLRPGFLLVDGRVVRALLRLGGELHVADWGRAQHGPMRLAFLGVQLLDRFRTTGDNVRG